MQRAMEGTVVQHMTRCAVTDQQTTKGTFDHLA